MYRIKYSIYKVCYYPPFQASTEGLQMYPPTWLRGNYCSKEKGPFVLMTVLNLGIHDKVSTISRRNAETAGRGIKNTTRNEQKWN